MYFIKYKCKIDPSKIMMLRFILEEHDGMAQMTTVSNMEGIVEINVPEGFLEDFHEFIGKSGHLFTLSVLE